MFWDWIDLLPIESSLRVELQYSTLNPPCVLRFSTLHWTLPVCWDSVLHIESSLCVEIQISTLNPPRVLYSTFPSTSGTYKKPESVVELILPVRGLAVGLWLSWIASVHGSVRNCIVLIFRFRWEQMAASAPWGALISIYGGIVYLLRLDGYECHSMNMKWRVGVGCHWTLLKIIAAKTMDLNPAECVLFFCWVFQCKQDIQICQIYICCCLCISRNVKGCTEVNIFYWQKAENPWTL